MKIGNVAPMSSELPFQLKSTVPSRGDASGLLHHPGEAVLIERGRPRWLLLMCPCGCGEEIPINLDRQAGPAWRLYRSHRHGISLYPSVWRDTGCEAHFIVWRSRILLFGGRHARLRSLGRREEIAGLASQVYPLLPARDFVSYVSIADTMGEVPWDVLDACRHLVHEGLAIEHAGDEHGRFKRRTITAVGLKGFSRKA
ncbi:DUF6527 family protein [Rhodanobacter sp. DHG33]|uniref:DUF6527 family protein n=1 Tax=Rhodanobacter sp. DHG33 TaxID=2775921 RepID=UPI001784EBAC|nr:DUF6527 family protein [Rhodanobacter sp. DHG33]MBD8900362.1 hypothetical protein [Rhodanobacter sp. DHG33]